MLIFLPYHEKNSAFNSWCPLNLKTKTTLNLKTKTTLNLKTKTLLLIIKSKSEPKVKDIKCMKYSLFYFELNLIFMKSLTFYTNEFLNCIT